MKLCKNKQIKQAYARYKVSNTTSIYQAYEKPSEEKVRIYRMWLNKIIDKFNSDILTIRIIGCNCMQFSLGFIFKDEQGIENFAYITKDNNRYCPLSELN